jgi:hypothetical protein
MRARQLTHRMQYGYFERLARKPSDFVLLEQSAASFVERVQGCSQMTMDGCNEL